MNIGPLEIAFVVGLVLLLFGPDKLPQLAKSFGKATKEYQKALKGVTDSGNNLIGDVKGQSSSKFESIPNTLSDDEQIIDNAKKLGIETQGKTINQIIEEILETTNS
ncbi:MAG: Sec-independent protein translocase subunit TatA/TatB [Candidatus Hodarchaeales archaeon]